MKNRRPNNADTADVDSPYWEEERGEDGRPIGQIFTKEIGWTLDDLEAAMLDRGTLLFQQNGRLVHLVRHNNDGVIDDAKASRPDGELVTIEANPHLVTEKAMEAAIWLKKNMRRDSSMPDPDNPGKMKKGVWERAPFPLELSRHYLARGQWKVRVLRGAIETPTLRPDGTLLTEPGYDIASQLYLDPGAVKFPAIAANPTREDAREALLAVLEPIKDFPFEPTEDERWGGQTASRSVALSAMLTGLVRASMATAPAHVIDAPVAGSGKSKLAEIATAVTTGRTPTLISYGSSQEEFQKRVFSVLYKGARTAIIDNIEQEVESDEFCTVLTATEWQSRVLGLSKMATVPTNTLWLFTGNRVTLKGDITDRVVVCNLDPRMEDPKTRTFDREPVAYVIEHRPDLVHAGLTILYAHALAGFPGAKGLSPSRFPDWDRMVRGALVWIGEPDPQSTRARVAIADPEREAIAAIMNGWADTVGLDVPVTAKALIDQSCVREEEDVTNFRWAGFGEIWPLEEAAVLHEALCAATNSPWPTAKSVGKRLAKLVGRVHNGHVIRSRPDAKAATTFWLTRA
jgi:hypothetical protein